MDKQEVSHYEEKIKQLLLLLMTFFIIWYFFFSLKNPCKDPVTYTLGSFSTEFSMSEKDFVDALDEGANVWNKAYGKNVLKQSKEGEITINFVYDERQATTKLHQKLETEVKENVETSEMIKERYETLKNDYQNKEKEYNVLFSLLQEHQNNYNKQVEYWNSQGGPPNDMYQILLKKEKVLKQEEKDVNDMRNTFNIVTDELNTYAEKYNTIVKETKKTITTINSSANEEFEEGVYDPKKKEITIYEFSSKEKLIRIIAHELGHALELPHNQNEESIMYPLNKAKSLSISNDDKKALSLRCKTGYRLFTFYYNAKELLSSKLQ